MTANRRTVLALACFCLAGFSASRATAQVMRQPDFRGIERFADSVLASYVREFEQPSLAVAVVWGDSVMLLKGYGLESGTTRRPVDPESTLFNIASVSKLFTATAAMQLVDAGKLSLDEDVRARLPGAAIVGDGPPITLRNLLTHTSGLDAAFMRAVVRTTDDLYPLQEYFARYPLRRGRPPNVEIRYSNAGMALVGRLVEVASGMRFEDYVLERVLRPQGMMHSTFKQPPPPALASRVAVYGSGPVPDALVLSPAGAMVSTAGDMARFMQAALRESVMLQPQWRADPAMPGVGLGFFMSDLGGVPGFFHTGARTHFSLLYLVPEHRLGIFIVHAMRQGGPHQNLRTEFARATIERILGTRDSVMAVQNQNWTRLSSFEGTYRPSLLGTTNIEKAARLAMDSPVKIGPEGNLAVKIPGGTRLALARVAENHFRVSEGPHRGMHVVFKRSVNGRITGFAISGSTQDPVSFERLSFLRWGRLHLILLLSSALLFAGVAVMALIARIFRKRRQEFEPMQIWAWRSAVIVGWLAMLGPLSAVVLVLTQPGEDPAAEGLRFALTVGLTLILVAAAISLTLPLFAWLAWQRRWWSRVRRTFFTVLATAAPIGVMLLWEYHLLGMWL